MTRILILLGGVALVLGSCASFSPQQSESVPASRNTVSLEGSAPQDEASADDAPKGGQSPTSPPDRQPADGSFGRLRPAAVTVTGEDSAAAGRGATLPAPSVPPAVGPPDATLPRAEESRRRADPGIAPEGSIAAGPLPAPALDTDAADPAAERRGLDDAGAAGSDGSDRPDGGEPPDRAEPPAAAALRAGAAEPREPASPETAESPAEERPDRRLPGPDPVTPPVLSLPLADSGTEPSSPLQEEVTSRVHSRTSVTLPGLGWTYLGNSTAVEYLGRSVRGDQTVFTFRPLEEGSHDLAFQRQDLRTGSAEESSVTLETTGVAPERPADTEDAVIDTASSEGGAPETAVPEGGAGAGEPAYRSRAGSGDYGEARELVAEGLDEEALAAYLRAYDGDSDVAAEIARLAERVGRLEAAIFFWEDAVEAGGAAEIQARERLFRHYVDRLAEDSPDAGLEADSAAVDPEADPLEAALEHAEALLKEDIRLGAEPGLQLAERLLAEGRPADAEPLLVSLTEGRGEASAQALYLLGRAYEARRRPTRAIAVYRRIMDNHLLSSYYEGARERYEYLRRHFLHVR